MPETEQAATANYGQLPSGLPLLVCLTCGSAVPPKAADFHDQWHRNIAGAAIDAQRRLDRVEATRV